MDTFSVDCLPSFKLFTIGSYCAIHSLRRSEHFERKHLSIMSSVFPSLTNSIIFLPNEDFTSVLLELPNPFKYFTSPFTLPPCC